MDKHTAFALGVALGDWARSHKAGSDPEVVIGMDTRKAARGLPSTSLEA